MTRIPDILWSWVDPGWTQGARFGREKRSPSDREIDKETKNCSRASLTRPPKSLLRMMEGDLYLSHVSPGWSMAPSFDRIKHPERYFLFAMPQPNDVALPTSQGSLSGGRCVRHANRSRWRRTRRRPTCRTHGTVARHALPVPPRGKASIPLQYEELSHDLRFSQ